MFLQVNYLMCLAANYAHIKNCKNLSEVQLHELQYLRDAEVESQAISTYFEILSVHAKPVSSLQTLPNQGVSTVLLEFHGPDSSQVTCFQSSYMFLVTRISFGFLGAFFDVSRCQLYTHQGAREVSRFARDSVSSGIRTGFNAKREILGHKQRNF